MLEVGDKVRTPMGFLATVFRIDNEHNTAVVEYPDGGYNEFPIKELSKWQPSP